MPEARRTLVKSPPELWAEVSDPDCLARHLAAFGEVRITRVEPESTVAWEGDRACGTVELAASGWGTKVTLRADAVEVEEPEPEPEPEPVEPPVAEEPPPVAEEPRRRGLWARWFRRRAKEEPAAAEEPAVVEEPAPIAEPPVAAGEIRVTRLGDEEAAAVLDGMLDTLGAAHHRPFSR